MLAQGWLFGVWSLTRTSLTRNIAHTHIACMVPVGTPHVAFPHRLAPACSVRRGTVERRSTRADLPLRAQRSFQQRPRASRRPPLAAYVSYACVVYRISGGGRFLIAGAAFLPPPSQNNRGDLGCSRRRALRCLVVNTYFLDAQHSPCPYSLHGPRWAPIYGVSTACRPRLKSKKGCRTVF